MSSLTISTWVRIDQADLDLGIDFPTGRGFTDNIPILMFGSSKPAGTAGGTGHVGSIFLPAATGGGSQISNNTVSLNLNARTGDFIGSGLTVTGSFDNDENGEVSFDPDEVITYQTSGVGLAGTQSLVSSTAGELLTQNWDFTGVLVNGHAPIAAHGGNPGNPSLVTALEYGWDDHFTVDTAPVYPSGLYFDASNNQVCFETSEQVIDQAPGFANTNSLLEDGSAFVAGSWNYIFFSCDISDTDATPYYMVVNLANSNLLDGGPNTLFHVMGGEQAGIPTIPQEIGNYFIVGKNQKMKFQHTQVWFDQMLTPSDIVPYFARSDGTLLTPPTDPFAAAKQFGTPDIHCYRKKSSQAGSNVYYQTNNGTLGEFAVVSSVGDFTPGPSVRLR